MTMLNLRRRACATLALCAACLSASAQVVEEVPFITSPDNVTLEMLRIAEVGTNDFVLDLGSGDGRIVITAARQFGARGLGVEIDPQLVARSNENARRAGVAERAQFREQDLFKTDLGQATVVTMYLLQEVNMQLRPSLLALKPGTRLVSHDWDMGDWKPDRTVVLDVPDKKVGLEKKSRVHLWVVPAGLQGLWCGAGSLGGLALNIRQKHQEVSIEVRALGRSRSYDGTVRGNVATVLTSQGATAMAFELQGERLRIVQARESLAMLRGEVLTRARGAACPA
jgi:hypothetical protein